MTHAFRSYQRNQPVRRRQPDSVRYPGAGRRPCPGNPAAVPGRPGARGQGAERVPRHRYRNGAGTCRGCHRARSPAGRVTVRVAKGLYRGLSRIFAGIAREAVIF
nr:MAG TPA: cytochrome C-like protein [Caudoviricetes sp.]